MTIHFFLQITILILFLKEVELVNSIVTYPNSITHEDIPDPFETICPFLKLVEAGKQCSLYIAQGEVYTNFNILKTAKLEEYQETYSSVMMMTGTKTDNENGTNYWFDWLKSESDPLKRKTSTCATVLLLCPIPDDCSSVLRFAAEFVHLETRYYKLVVWGYDVTKALLHKDFSNFLYKIGVEPSLDNTYSNLKSVCFFCDAGEQHPVHLGTYNHSTKSLQPLTLNLFPDYTLNLHRKFMEGTFMYPYSPPTVRFRQRHMLPVFYAKVVLTDISVSLNFDFNISQFSLEAGAVDTQIDNGSWVGMVAEVLYGRSNLSGPTPMTERGLGIVDYTAAFVIGQETFIRRRPAALYSWTSILKPYTSTMWLLILISCIFATIFFRYLLMILQTIMNPFAPRKPPRFQWSYSLEYIFAPLMEENPTLIPTSHSTRMFLSLWWIFAIIISFGYDTKLISFLVLPDYEAVPNTYRELITFPKWSWGKGKEHMVFFRMLLENSVQEYHHTLFRGAVQTESLSTCVSKSKLENFACSAYNVYLEIESMKHLYTDGYNPLELADDSSVAIVASFILPKYSVLLPVFNRRIQSIRAAGLVDYYSHMQIYTSFWQGLLSARKENRIHDVSMALKIDQMKGPLLVFGICHIITISVFVYELLKYNRKVRYSIRTNNKKT